MIQKFATTRQLLEETQQVVRQAEIAHDALEVLNRERPAVPEEYTVRISIACSDFTIAIMRGTATHVMLKHTLLTEIARLTDLAIEMQGELHESFNKLKGE